MSSGAALRLALQSPGVRWIGGGWTLFLGENLVLSENRDAIISVLGEGGYHTLYNTLSGAACASIAFGYLRHGRNATGPPLWLWTGKVGQNPRLPAAVAVSAFGCQALGLAGFSQLVPGVRLPWRTKNEKGEEEENKVTNNNNEGLRQQQQEKPKPQSAATAAAAAAAPSSTSSTTVVLADTLQDDATTTATTNATSSPSSSHRQPQSHPQSQSQPQSPRYVSQCPIDFTPPDIPTDGIYGMKRITRHPQLWSLGLLGAGAALGSIAAPNIIFFGFPFVFALVGGAHIDARHRRGSGGSLTPEVDARTSLIPFAALMTGYQSWEQLGAELKMNNVTIAVGLAALLALRRQARFRSLTPLTSTKMGRR